MHIRHEKIFDSWGEKLVVDSYEDFMAIDQNLLYEMIIQRNLIVIKGLSPDLNDEEFYALGNKFGKVWTQEDYKKTFITRGFDPTVSRTTATPISYFKTDNNMFKDTYMGYHADMAHIKDMSYPGRALYMVNNTEDGSGDTTWLNLELGWQLMTQEERDRYAECELIFQDFYLPGTRMEKLPFIKINPKTGKTSPRINCFARNNDQRAWINHAVKNGVELTFDETGILIRNLYQLLESKQDTLYCHSWSPGDIIVYDNWFNVHKREKVNGKRLLKRLTFNIQ
jgi:alpha-ketoglutarate-dependent taurine dioxygenase